MQLQSKPNHNSLQLKNVALLQLLFSARAKAETSD